MLLMIAAIVCSFFWTNIPAEGSMSGTAPVPSAFRFGYIFAKGNQADLREWMNKNKDIPFLAGADRLFDKNTSVSLSNFYPVFDGSSSLEQFNGVYSYLPADAVQGWGRSIYSVDYVNTRLLFLHDSALSSSESVALNWLEQTININKQAHSIVFMDKSPELPVFWESLHKWNVDLIVTEHAVYAPQHLVTQEPSEFGSGQHPGWGEWKPSMQFVDSHALVIEWQGERLIVKAINKQGKSLDQLEETAAQFKIKENENLPTLVGMQSVWRYHPGGSGIKVTIPEGIDITGENPITSRVTLASDDWRSPQYDDSSWKFGEGPLGHSKSIQMKQWIQTTLPIVYDSPTYYFRKSFILNEDPAELTKLLLHIAYEDGYVVYLNGEEVSRDGIRTGLLKDSSLAVPNEPAFYQIKDLKNHIPKLVKGTNVLAVEVHRSHPKSANLLFDLSLSYQR